VEKRLKDYNIILKTRIGSHCHNINMPESDQDIRYIFIPTIDYYFSTALQHDMIQNKTEEKDEEYWSINKLFALCIKGNPSSLNILFAHSKDQLESNDIGKEVLNFRYNFLSRRTVNQCLGYTVSQIHKLEIGRGTKEGKRIEMIEKYGFDVKFAVHCVMLTNIAIELCKTGIYRPYRPNSEAVYLKAIRRGEVPLEDIRKQVKSNIETIEVIKSICPLPEEPDEALINNFLINLLTNYFNLNKKG